MTTNSFMARVGMGFGIPLAVAAILGTGIVVAQQSDEGSATPTAQQDSNGTPVPDSTETPSDGTTPESDRDGDKWPGRDGCPEKGDSEGGSGTTTGV